MVRKALALGALVALFSGAAILPVAAWNLWHSRMLAGGPVSTQPDEASYLDWIPLNSPGEMVPFLRRTLGSNIPEYWATGAANLADPFWLGAVLAGDIAAVQKACPETLRYLGLAEGWSRAAFWRVEGDGSCLREHFPLRSED